jgi:hypothetical protein
MFMFKKKLILASYPLVHLGLFAFTCWISWLFVNATKLNQLDNILLVVGVLLGFVLQPLILDDSYFKLLLSAFSKQTQQKCKAYCSYLDKVTLGLFISLVVSVFIGEPFYSSVTEFLLYIAFGLYVSSSAVIMLFLSRK